MGSYAIQAYWYVQRLSGKFNLLLSSKVNLKNLELAIKIEWTIAVQSCTYIANNLQIENSASRTSATVYFNLLATRINVRIVLIGRKEYSHHQCKETRWVFRSRSQRKKRLILIYVICCN